MDRGRVSRSRRRQHATSQPVYRRLTPAELLAQPAPSWLVVDLIPSRGLLVWYGESAAGKTLLLFDLAVHLARGERWAGRRTKQARVVYVALEGNMRDRLEAYKTERGLDDADLAGVRIIQGQSVDLLNEADTAEQLAADIRTWLGDWTGPVVVILDTLARTMPGGNENGSEHMGAVVAAAQVLERELAALVGFVHHVGKDATKGSRGWSGVKGATDAEVRIERDGDARRATFTKVKDGEDGVCVEFRLAVVDLGPRSDTDADAGPDERRTSCVAVVTNADAAEGEQASARKE